MKLTFLGAADQVLEEVDGDAIITWEIGIAVNGQEVVDLPLGSGLGGEGGSIDLMSLPGVGIDLLHD